MKEIINQRECLNDWILEQAKPLVIMEVGVWKGHTVKGLLRRECKKYIKEYWAIDKWEEMPPREYDGETLRYGRMGAKSREDWKEMYECVAQLMMWPTFEPLRVLRMSGDTAATYFKKAKKQFDLIFIDADHYYDAVKHDINLFLPLVKPGGTLSGHDIGNRHCGVTKAVNEIFGDNYYWRPGSNTWMVKVEE